MFSNTLLVTVLLILTAVAPAIVTANWCFSSYEDCHEWVEYLFNAPADGCALHCYLEHSSQLGNVCGLRYEGCYGCTCKRYGRYLDKRKSRSIHGETMLKLAPPPVPGFGSNPTCGKPIFQPEVLSPRMIIVGGIEANPHSWPWQCLVTTYLSSSSSSYYNMCGGSVIGNRWILTAAHCLYVVQCYMPMERVKTTLPVVC